VLGLVISWFAALIGPTSVPMILGLLPVFRQADQRAAIASIFAGFAAFVLLKYAVPATAGMLVLTPLATSIIVFSGFAALNRRSAPPAVTELLAAVSGRGERPQP
jgi:hypothetical protein